jgi:hypothetical protein
MLSANAREEVWMGSAAASAAASLSPNPSQMAAHLAKAS